MDSKELKYNQMYIDSLNIYVNGDAVYLNNNDKLCLAKILTKNKIKNKESFLAGYYVNHAILADDFYNLERKRAINSYRHKINLTSIKDEIKYKYDKDFRPVFLQWHNAKGLSVDVIAPELENYGIYIRAINPADQFFEILDILESCKLSKFCNLVTLNAIKTDLIKALKNGETSIYLDDESYDEQENIVQKDDETDYELPF